MSDAAGLELFPAVDVAGGRAVGLKQAQYSSASTYGDPIELALGWQEQGARWLHLVDIDAAFGRGHNAAVLAGVIEALDSRPRGIGRLCQRRTRYHTAHRLYFQGLCGVVPGTGTRAQRGSPAPIR